MMALPSSVFSFDSASYALHPGVGLHVAAEAVEVGVGVGDCV